MGYRHTSTQFGGHGAVWPADGGAAGAAARQRGSCVHAAGARLIRALLLGAIRAYQAVLSGFLGGACKFSPSCSSYAYQAVERWGARRGARLALGRLLRCRPFSAGGWDPVPEPPADGPPLGGKIEEGGE
jgi:putative membrane protein insertion efficiency factor